ncbi:LLM class F420-dependent oxidoreductase [Actinopolymorpha singaporensis]|uniref:F420-dependent oxidoreductase, G6PDH family n=1 Tax=Actinopolymorpha singaporensis TaxID=117157 RepID=A0A1H1PJ46_9ACTN|nr:LLM class F420-dependent oxidoreductase [Actinopolymorpha singaporensis]SDS11143.1 F420-dependent oxidoreductase, G6PDH family [Actinopolymorpha singaporensis]
MRLGYFLSCEEFTPAELVAQAKLAERAGFEALWISDHYHPWNDEQGQSAFVWSMIGAISQVCSLPITTAVTCPTIRIHPAIVAQAAATSQVLLDGRFALGVGSGEALNEHILGDPWPATSTRLDMLEEAIEVMRKLFTGKVVNHDGPHYTVEHARLYTCPDQPPPIYVSAFGPEAARRAGQVGDGLCTTMPDASLLEEFRSNGGEGKPTQVGFKVCYGTDAGKARATAHRLWANEQLPGELAQVLPYPEHFMQASSLVTEDMVGEALVCGDDLDEHISAVKEYADAGFDEVYVNQIGPDQEAFFGFYAEKVLPRVRGR